MTYTPPHTSMADAMAEIINPTASATPAPSPDQSVSQGLVSDRHDADKLAAGEIDDKVTTAEALRLYEQAGTPISERSIQRYCLSGRLTAAKSYDANGMVYYLIDRASIDADIQRLKSAPLANRLPPQAPAFNASALAARTAQHHEAKQTQMTSIATRSSVMVAQLTHHVAQLEGERVLLREQLSRKDEQIAALNTQAAANSRTIDMLNALLDKASRYFPNV